VNRRRFVAGAAGLGVGIPLATAAFGRASSSSEPSSLSARPLRVPADGTIRTAFAIGPGVNVIDTAGPWEVFQDAAVYGGAGFQLYTVAEDRAVVTASGGLAIEPTYTYDTAPDPHVVVIPAQQSSERTVRWLRDVGRRADLLMSVCTGAFVLAETGLLDGKTATTHHQSWDDFESSFPAIEVVRGSRFVEHDRVATAGGLTSGIDLALRVVERYLGREAAVVTARYMEYERL
jgi:transcriptional regulator GlxA family with amidase domain